MSSNPQTPDIILLSISQIHAVSITSQQQHPASLPEHELSITFQQQILHLDLSMQSITSLQQHPAS